ncbi:hypothetical protein O7621_08290 [Solwaraspora sp. WMMD937]|uniref:hypothetical protein n=1 Tax=Solwaraspora sp. WMMD937 TaxID=3016090 RepID=UPI00249AD2B9|nr:hypothetical protein [Solwaraspora sp. WMMD937]WFE23287.1 hypothetical protein O7621_08290 [Solwaraspora sp. WMMD937]
MSATDEVKKLSVPVTAVYARPDGTMFVSIAEATGDVTDVTVKVDRIAGGWVGITPETDLLRPGTLVVVGEHANELQPADP